MSAATSVTPQAITAARASIGMLIDARDVAAAAAPRSRRGSSAPAAVRRRRRRSPAAGSRPASAGPGAAACAQRLPHRELPAARRAARQQQVRDVGAGHDEQNRRRAEQQRQDVAQAADQVGAQRHHLRDEIRRWCADTRARAAPRSRSNSALCLPPPRRQAAAGRSRSSSPAAQRRLDRLETLLRQPDDRFRPARAIVEQPQLEAGRHHADDGVGVVLVEAHRRPTMDAIAAEAARATTGGSRIATRGPPRWYSCGRNARPCSIGVAEHA